MVRDNISDTAFSTKPVRADYKITLVSFPISANDFAKNCFKHLPSSNTSDRKVLYF